MEERILMAHGGGGRLMHRLIEEIIAPSFSMTTLSDAAVLDMPSGGRLASTTDSYVVSPIFFPGGNIGELAVCGTVNDLAVVGALPLYLTAGFILEEGLPIEDFKRVVTSMSDMAQRAGVSIVAGDTKVVERGRCEGIYINTAGIGVVPEGVELAPTRIRSGDVVAVSGPCGTHGMAIMAERNGLTFSPALESDTAPLNGLIGKMLKAAPGIRMLRDPTRGGLATTVKEIAREARKRVVLREAALPVLPGVRGGCDLLGLDPLYVANEGVVVCIVDPADAEVLLGTMKSHHLGRLASAVGVVGEEEDGKVLLETQAGGIRMLDMLAGEQLPRIC